MMASSNPTCCWSEPRCLIESDNDGAISINADTMSSLQQITDPVVVVGIVGLYRTGKSYLMNKLAGNQSGFALGSTVQSKTKGIWIWCVPHPKRQNCCLLLLDTEGLGDVEKGDETHDVKIFALAVLLTSTLVYNSMGTIDQNALDKLYFVSNLADHVKIKANSEVNDDGDDSSIFEKFFPSFVWAVRDFMLDLEIDGKQITEDEYLEHALKLKHGAGKKISEYNLPRDCIRTFFPHRKCIVFPKPVDDSSRLKRLDDVRDDELNPSFVEQTHKFLNFVFDNTRVKTIAGRNVNGRIFAGLAHSYVEAIRNGAIPCIESAVERTAKLENERAILESVELYKKLVSESVQIPTNTMLDLSNAHHVSERQASEYFLKLAIFDSDKTYYERMTEEIAKCYQDICHQNEAASKRRCEELLKILYQPMEEAFKSGAFACPGGYGQYKCAMEDLVAKYRATPLKGVMADEVLYEFSKSQEATSMLVLKSDEKLCDEAKKLAEEQRRAELAEEQKLAAEEDRKKSEQLLRDKQKSYEEHVARLEEQTKEEHKKLREDNEKLIEQKLKEQERLMQEGFRDRSEQMKREIDDLRHTMQQQQQNESSGGGFFDFLGNIVTAILPIPKIFKFFR